MYHSHVVPLTDCSAGIWDYLKPVEGEKIQNKAIVLVYAHVKTSVTYADQSVFEMK